MPRNELLWYSVIGGTVGMHAMTLADTTVSIDSEEKDGLIWTRGSHLLRSAPVPTVTS